MLLFELFFKKSTTTHNDMVEAGYLDVSHIVRNAS